MPHRDYFILFRKKYTRLVLYYPKSHKETPNGYETMKLSEYVRSQRKQHHLTQADLAERAGVGLRFIRELERDKPTLRLDKVNVVLALFGHQLGPVPVKFEEASDARS